MSPYVREKDNADEIELRWRWAIILDRPDGLTSSPGSPWEGAGGVRGTGEASVTVAEVGGCSLKVEGGS